MGLLFDVDFRNISFDLVMVMSLLSRNVCWATAMVQRVIRYLGVIAAYDSIVRSVVIVYGIYVCCSTVADR